MGGPYISGSPDIDRRQFRKQSGLLVVMTVCVVADVVGGLMSGSLALLALASQMLFAVALLGFMVHPTPSARLAPTVSSSRSLPAILFAGAALIAVSVHVLVEAARRFAEAPEVRGVPMMILGAGGLMAHLLVLRTLSVGTSSVRYLGVVRLHRAGAVASLWTILAGWLVWDMRWGAADTAAAVGAALLVVYSSGKLLIDALTARRTTLSARLVVDGSRPPDDVLRDVQAVLAERFGLQGTGLKLERPPREDPAARRDRQTGEPPRSAGVRTPYGAYATEPAAISPLDDPVHHD